MVVTMARAVRGGTNAEHEDGLLHDFGGDDFDVGEVLHFSGLFDGQSLCDSVLSLDLLSPVSSLLGLRTSLRWVSSFLASRRGRLRRRQHWVRPSPKV